jgi:HD-GYP domain-containing protein (c-di-GMP phosphodiesterase class II)
MEIIEGKEWIPVRRSNLKYYDNVELYYRNPSRKIALYKPAGTPFGDAQLAAKPYLGQLYIRPQDKIRALREAQRGFSQSLTSRVQAADIDSLDQVKNDLSVIVDETLSEPRSGSLEVVPRYVGTIVEGFSSNPTVVRNLAVISNTDYTTAIHSINVMALTIGFCYYVQRSLEETQQLGLAALLHDVGKVEVDPEILTAPRRLTDEEFAEMSRHPELGVSILTEYGTEFEFAITGVLEHHQKLDGSGYPPGRSGTSISETGRLIAIIDAYEALTNDDRPYRSGMAPIAALKLIKKDADAGLFDSRLFAQFAYSLTDFGSRRLFETDDSMKVHRPEVEALTPEPAG